MTTGSASVARRKIPTGREEVAAAILGGCHRSVRRAWSGRDVDPRHRRPIEGQPRTGVSSLRNQGSAGRRRARSPEYDDHRGAADQPVGRGGRTRDRPAHAGDGPHLARRLPGGEVADAVSRRRAACSISSARATTTTAARVWPWPMPLRCSSGGGCSRLSYARRPVSTNYRTPNCRRRWAPRWPGSSPTALTRSAVFARQTRRCMGSRPGG
jgi:hypothetical protein